MTTQTQIAPALELKIDGKPRSLLTLVYQLDNGGGVTSPGIKVIDDPDGPAVLTRLHKIELSIAGQPFQEVSETFLLTMLQMYGQSCESVVS